MNFNFLLEELLLELSGKEIYQKYYSKIPYDTFLDIVVADPKTNIDGTGELLSLGKYAKMLLSFYLKFHFYETTKRLQQHKKEPRLI